MVQFKILGQELKLPENFSISFSSNNPIFDFGSIQLIRTQSFFVPSCAENDLLFGFTGRHDRFGDMAREILNAELIYSGGKIDGRLYIDECNNGYSCVFVFGEMLKLKEIKESGEITKYLNFTNTIQWANGVFTTNPTTSFYILGLYKYSIYGMEPNISAGWNFMPTVSFKYLLDSCKNYFDVEVNLGSYLSKINLMGIKLNGLNATDTEVVPEMNIVGGGTNPYFSGYNGAVLQEVTLPSDFVEAWEPLKSLKIRSNYKVRFRFTLPAMIEGDYAYAIACFYVYSSDGVLKKIIANSETDEKYYDFYLDLEKYDMFGFYQQGGAGDSPARINLNIPFTCNVMGTGGKIEYGDMYPLLPNLPALTFIDLLQIVAKTTETAILYDETTNEISFFEFDDWLAPINISERIIKKGSLLRRFSNFAQKSIVKFANSDKVQAGTENEDIFYLQNESIEAEKVIHEIKLSGGGKNKEYGINPDAKKLILGDIERVVAEDGGISYKFGTDKDTLVEWDAETLALRPVEFVQNTQLRAMIQKSTIIKRDIEMTLNEYLNVKHNSTFLIDGIVYAWVSRKWSKNVASFELQKK